MGNCFGRSFKTKETRDSNNNSNESPRSRNFTRDNFRRNQQSQEASSSLHPETSDHSSVHFSPTDSRTLETSLSHDTELADRLQCLLAERQRQEISSSDHPETSDHSFADSYLSQQKVRLKNGSEVLAGDIPPIMASLGDFKKSIEVLLSVSLPETSRATALEGVSLPGISRATALEGAMSMIGTRIRFESMCKDPNEGPLSDKDKKLLQGLIDERTGKPSDSVKNIVLSLDGSHDYDNSPVVERVKLRNNSEEDTNLAKTAMSILRVLREKTLELYPIFTSSVKIKTTY